MMRVIQCSLILIALLFCNLWGPESVLASTDALFEIGSTNYYLNGSGRNIDVSPYVKDGRTFIPILYVAEALGISGDNVMWDGQNKTVTLMKADKIVKLWIGSTTLVVNGVDVNMDVGPEISNGRTCLPIALIAQAFGATVSWDAATQTIRLSSDFVSNDSNYINSDSNQQVDSIPNDSTPSNTIEPPVIADLTGTWHSPNSIFWITQTGNNLSGTLHDTSQDMSSADWSVSGTVSGNTVTLNLQKNLNSSYTESGVFDLKENGNRMEGTLDPSWTSSYSFVIERVKPGDLTGIWHSQGSTFWLVQSDDDNLVGHLCNNTTKEVWNMDGNVSGDSVTITFTGSQKIKGIFELKNDRNLLEGTMYPSQTDSYHFVIQR
ncbi:MAG: copper amine oxidase N-terminal domain-containing protein [Syntrophomonadaceae bacterium]